MQDGSKPERDLASRLEQLRGRLARARALIDEVRDSPVPEYRQAAAGLRDALRDPATTVEEHRRSDGVDGCNGTERRPVTTRFANTEPRVT